MTIPEKYSHDKILQLNKHIVEAEKNTTTHLGRKYEQIMDDLSLEKPEDFSLNSLVSDLKLLENIDVDEKDLPLFNSVMGRFKNLLDRDLSSKDQDLNTVFQNVFKPVSKKQAESLLEEGFLYKTYIDMVEEESQERIFDIGEQMGMTSYETTGVVLYTTDLYLLVNANLRGQEQVVRDEIENLHATYLVETPLEDFIPECLAEVELIKNAMLSGLSKLQEAEGTIYRGDLLSDNELKLMQTSTYYDLGIMSWSRNRKEALTWSQREATNDLEKYRVLLKIKECKDGKNATPLSAHEEENEVIYLPGKKFKAEKTKNIDKSDVSIQTFELEEIEDE